MKFNPINDFHFTKRKSSSKEGEFSVRREEGTKRGKSERLMQTALKHSIKVIETTPTNKRLLGCDQSARVERAQSKSLHNFCIKKLIRKAHRKSTGKIKQRRMKEWKSFPFREDCNGISGIFECRAARTVGFGAFRF